MDVVKNAGKKMIADTVSEEKNSEEKAFVNVVNGVKTLGKKPFVAAVSGVKNSGKTTFLEKLVAELKMRGYRVAIIKHDGHEFEPDVAGTDTWKLRQAGAYGTAIFSKGQWMVCKQEPGMDEMRMMELFPEADFILLEGFKYSSYPKFEIVREGNSFESVCDARTLLGLVTDTKLRLDGVPMLGLEDWKAAADILEKVRGLNY